MEVSLLLQKVQHMFKYDIVLCDRLYIVDAQAATSADIKALKQALLNTKQDIVNVCMSRFDFDLLLYFCLIEYISSFLDNPNLNHSI